MLTLGALIVGSWFGMLVMALARAASDNGASPTARSSSGIELTDRHGDPVVLGPDGRTHYPARTRKANT